MNGMSIIVKTIARLLAGFVFLFGVYLVLFGHLSPGGGFAGGVVIAASFVLLLLACGKELTVDIFDYEQASMMESLGALLFLGAGLSGALNSWFFTNLRAGTMWSGGTPGQLLSGGMIPFCNIAIGMKVGAALFAIILVLTAFKSPKKE
jgi:multicomponent Na+:H+ antiporter subunit B